MFGNNALLTPENGDGTYLKIHSIFDTIQGEGPYAGTPSVFIRLAGCNLACTFCDTEFDQYNEMAIIDILSIVQLLSPTYRKLIVITGGEPFRQPISLLCQELIKHGFKVQIETNGLLYREIPREVNIVCSPKNTGRGYHRIREDLLPHINAIKFLISAINKAYQNIADVGQIGRDIKVYVQPIDEYDYVKNLDNIILATKIAKEHGAILSLQLHKILGMP